MKLNKLKEKLPYINFWIHVIAGGAMIFVIWFNYSQIQSLKSDVQTLKADFEGISYDSKTPDNTPYMAYEAVTYSGVIKKEKIPEEYALGDYWYILYFSEPQMLETAAGKMLRDSIQVQASTIDSFDGYLDSEVIVKGRLSYGYAESRIVLVDEVKSK